jgi:hypothetical protein
MPERFHFDRDQLMPRTHLNRLAIESKFPTLTRVSFVSRSKS